MISENSISPSQLRAKRNSLVMQNKIVNDVEQLTSNINKITKWSRFKTDRT